MSYDHSLPVANVHTTSSVRNLIELCDCLNNPHRVTDEYETGSISVVHLTFPAKRADALVGASVRLVLCCIVPSQSRFDAYLHQYMQSLPYTGYLVNECLCDLGAEALQRELRTLFVSELN